MPGNYCFIQPKICFTGRPILDAVKSVFNGKKRDRLLTVGTKMLRVRVRGKVLRTVCSKGEGRRGAPNW